MLVRRKWIEDNAINGPKFRLDNSQYLRARNNTDTGDVNILQVNSANRIEFASIPQAAGTPAQANDLINLSFLQAYAAGIRDPKDACRAAATGNLALTGGASLTVDGVSMANGDRLLLPLQTTASQNGIYVVSGIGTAYTLTRATDANEDAEVTQGLSTVVVEGATNGQKQFVLSTQDPIVVGTTALTFVSFPASATYTGGDMISLVGNDFRVDLAAVSGLESTNPGNAAGQLRIRVSDAALVTDRTTAISGTNAIESLRSRKQSFTLTGTDISNGYVDLDRIAHRASLVVWANGSPHQVEGSDYNPNYTGGGGGNTRVAFAGDLTSLLAAADILYVQYTHLN